MPPNAVAAAGSRGIDLSAHRSRIVTPELLDAADIVLVMDAAQASALQRIGRGAARAVILLGDLDPEARDGRVIADPWAKPVSEFSDVYERIDRCCRVVASAISA